MKKYLMGIRKWIGFEIIVDMILSLSSAMFILGQKKIVDRFGDNNLLNLKDDILLIIMAAVGILICSYFTMYFTWKSTTKFEQMLREDFFSKITMFSRKKFFSKDIGDYVSIQGNDIRTMSVNYLSAVITGIKSVSMFIIYSVIMFVNYHNL